MCECACDIEHFVAIAVLVYGLVHVTLISLHSLALCVVVREPLVTQIQARKTFFICQFLVVRQRERKERNSSHIPYLTRYIIQGVNPKS